MSKLILASASPRRSEILKRCGIDFEVIKSECEENTEQISPAEVVIDLSYQKADDIIGRILEDEEKLSKYVGDAKSELVCVLSADTVVADGNGSILGKPKDEEDAFNMLKGLSGGYHEVYTGFTLFLLQIMGQEKKGIVKFKSESQAVCTKVKVCSLTDEEINAYIATGEPMDKAGSYGIQGYFSKYVEEIQGSYDNVVGLPISQICALAKLLAAENEEFASLTGLFGV